MKSVHEIVFFLLPDSTICSYRIISDVPLIQKYIFARIVTYTVAPNKSHFFKMNAQFIAIFGDLIFYFSDLLYTICNEKKWKE